MSPTSALAIVAVTIATTWLGTLLVRRYAIERAILDVPNQRSSHAIPTPRGGGIALVASILGYMVVATLVGWLPARIAIGLGGGMAAVAAIGWLDDHRSVSARLRLIVHLASAAWAVAWLGGLPSLDLGTRVVELGWLGSLLAVLLLAGATNVYNFMDGIDGIAGVEGVTVSGAAAALLLATSPAHAGVALAVLGSCLGFLLWNWAPARIFMGDVGSGALGFLLAGLGVATERAGALPLLAWAILLAVFLVDGTVTILRRAWRREPLHVAHRKHAYQRLVQSGFPHGRVSALVLMVNVLLALIAWWGVHSERMLTAAAAASLLVGLGYLAVERREPFRNAP